MFARRVEPELLDHLPAADLEAQRSRADLRRLHRFMGTLAIGCSALDRATAGVDPRSLLEIGAGDGSLLLRLAEKRAKRWPDVRVTLLDRVNVVAPATLDAIRATGWKPAVVTADVFDYLAIQHESRWNVIWANLLLHHFERDDLVGLLGDVAERTSAFVCCEPRRTLLPLASSRLVGLTGAGRVTRHDALASVRAGFRAKELSHMWPKRRDWLLHEYPAGLFSHCFMAIRKRRG